MGASGDSADTARTFESSDVIQIADEFEEERPDSYRYTYPVEKTAIEHFYRPHSLQLNCNLKDIIRVVRQDSEPVTAAEKSKSITQIQNDNTLNSSNINLISLVKFIRTRSMRANSPRTCRRFDEEKSDDAGASSHSSSKLFSCSICLENNCISEAFSYSSCHDSHQFCRQCLKSYVTSQIRDGVIVHRCPHTNCHAQASDMDIQCLVEEHTYQRYLRYRNIKMNPSYRECTACQQHILIPAGFFQSSGVAESPLLLCSCGHSTCYYHGDVHTGKSCEEYTRGARKEERANRRLLNVIARRCPQCRAETEKFGGCNHMVRLPPLNGVHHPHHLPLADVRALRGGLVLAVRPRALVRVRAVALRSRQHPQQLRGLAVRRCSARRVVEPLRPPGRRLLPPSRGTGQRRRRRGSRQRR